MYKIYLVNNTIITEDKCEWMKLPNIPITQIEYGIGNGKIIRMSGFDSYIVLKEYYQFLQGASGKMLHTVNILGKFKDKTYQFSLNIPKQKALQRQGDSIKEFAPMVYDTTLCKYTFGTPQKTNPSLWKMGFPLHTPIAQII
jgi:hypothetical protein